jgi:membrane-associated phospholipid phosphatase
MGVGWTKELWLDYTALAGLPLYAVVTGTLWFLGAHEAAWKLFVGFFVLYAAIIPFRLLYFKERPDRVSHKNVFQKIHASSFPSMHSARAIFFALILGMWAKNTIFLAVLLILGAGVAVSRVKLKRHDWIDISVGAVLGFVLGYLIWIYV